MSYVDLFTDTDQTIQHLSTIVSEVDIVLQSQYAGFAAVSAITVYELAIKNVFFEFSRKKHISYGNFVEKHFHRINGRIGLKDIRDEYLPRFGEKYKNKFQSLLNLRDAISIAQQNGSVKSSYGNLVVWRNEFAHEGRVPTNATFAEVYRAYDLGKIVIDCLAQALVR